MTRNRIIKYINHTPCNTNGSVINSMLDEYEKTVQQMSLGTQVDEDNDYLYEKTYTDWSYEDGEELLRTYAPKPAGCSSLVAGDFHCRNYDWTYDNTIEFVLHCNSPKYPHKSVGIAHFDSFNTNTIDKLSVFDYAVLPFKTVDGINDAGVSCNINVVPLDHGYITGTHPGKPNLGVSAVVRMILDYADSADHALQLLDQYNIYSAAGKIHYEVHYMISDANKTYIIEFINNKMNVIDEFINNKPIMTNFFIAGFNGNKSSLTPHGAGFERYNILKENYDSIVDEESAFAAMQLVNYTVTYAEDTLWYSEFVGETAEFGDLTNSSPIEDILPYMNIAKQWFSTRSRDTGTTWQTVHTSVYNHTDKTLSLQSQEDGTNTYTFTIE